MKQETRPANVSDDEDVVDFSALFHRLRQGVAIVVGLSLVGFAIGTIISAYAGLKQPAVSALRVTFSFPGFERGHYPNATKFQVDDIRAPDLVNEAIRRLGISSLSSDIQSRIRGAIGVSGFVSPNIIKERDRMRAAGQTPPAYFPDEYEISLSLPRDFPLNVRNRELLLAEIVNAYQEKFRRTYVELPPEFGNAFDSLLNSDFVEYELILTKEIRSLASYLEQKIEKAKLFRSPTNALSFQDLLKQTELFSQIRLNDVLGLIYINGLSKDRSYALVKMDYYLRTLEDQEQRLKEEETVVSNLLGQTQQRGQSYVLATKAESMQTPRPEQPMFDQGFIDTLLANDAYNFLVRKALEAGLAVRRVQADKMQLLERKRRMESFAKGEIKDQATVIAATRSALEVLEKDYLELLNKVRVCLDDYARQEFGDAVRITMQSRTNSWLPTVLIGGSIGLLAGLALGAGISVLRVPAPSRS